MITDDSPPKFYLDSAGDEKGKNSSPADLCSRLLPPGLQFHILIDGLRVDLPCTSGQRCGSIMMPEARDFTGTSIANPDKPSKAKHIEEHITDCERHRAK